MTIIFWLRYDDIEYGGVRLNQIGSKRKEEKGMSINFGSSNLFGMGGGSSAISGLYGLVGEYNNIRSGAYYKAAKAYYAKNTDSSSKTTKNSSKTNENNSTNKTSTSSAAYTKVVEDAKKVQTAAAKLSKTGKNSLFEPKEKTVTDEKTGEKTKVTEIDREAIESAVKDFVSAYNDTLSSAETSKDTSVNRNVGYMKNQSKIFSRALEEVGISIEKDGSLTVDKDKLASAKTENLKTLFNGKNSYGSFVSQRASMVSSAATKAASDNSLYNSSGSYQNYAVGSMDWFL